ncbi:MAG: pantetheine-phosphate adenylyltransferase [Elusimicrobia bacterium]|nr:pantetheine-phosphate adenylyltransferase [Elusimicrobiota bacterium]
MKQKKTVTAVYPGSFDPITYGHLDIIRRAREIFGTIVVAISRNTAKTPMFSLEERKILIVQSLKEHSMTQDVHVETFSGLLADYLKQRGLTVVIRGLRFLSDFEYEFQMALMNRRLYPKMETVYLMPDEQHIYLSSSIVKEIAMNGKNPREFAPPCVTKALLKQAQLKNEK